MGWTKAAGKGGKRGREMQGIRKVVKAKGERETRDEVIELRFGRGLNRSMEGREGWR